MLRKYKFTVQASTVQDALDKIIYAFRGTHNDPTELADVEVVSEPADLRCCVCGEKIYKSEAHAVSLKIPTTFICLVCLGKITEAYGGGNDKHYS